MLAILAAALSFFTTLPIRGDVEVLRRNLWFLPIAGAIVGLLISAPIIIFDFIRPDLRIVAVVAYILIEGINHVDGLADFGDAFFAPPERKKQALKDLNIGAGGVSFVVIYLLLISYAFLNVSVFAVVLSQMLAKYAMLLLMITSKPSWDGMASYMMRYASWRDAVVGLIPIIPFIFSMQSILAMIAMLAVVLAVRIYSERNFGGVSGDVLGATNCITFATSLLILR